MGRKIITLISDEQAYVGNVFKIFKIPDECKRCPLYNICISKLKPGRKYKIIEVRRFNLPKPHKCLLTGQSLTSVVVEELPVVIAIPKMINVIEGVVIRFELIDEDCQKKLAIKYGGDYPVIENGCKIKILKIIGKEFCKGKEYLIVECEIVD